MISIKDKLATPTQRRPQPTSRREKNYNDIEGNSAVGVGLTAFDFELIGLQFHVSKVDWLPSGLTWYTMLCWRHTINRRKHNIFEIRHFDVEKNATRNYCDKHLRTRPTLLLSMYTAGFAWNGLIASYECHANTHGNKTHISEMISRRRFEFEFRILDSTMLKMVELNRWKWNKQMRGESRALWVDATIWYWIKYIESSLVCHSWQHLFVANAIWRWLNCHPFIDHVASLIRLMTIITILNEYYH